MQVRTGTVTVTSNSPTVTGEGTSWLNVVLPGAMFLVRGDATPYYVAQVVSNTQITLSAPYQGATRGNQFYWITTSFTPNKNYPIPENGDVDPALILSRAIAEIDADMGAGGAGGGASKLGQLTDVSEAGVANGDVLTRLPGGTYGFAPAGTALINGANLGSGAAVFAGKVGDTLNYKSITFDGASVVTTANDITVMIPAPGEVNTASSIGSQSALSVFARKFGVNLEFRGMRAGAGMTISQDGNDLVFASTAVGGNTGEANTASNLGTGTVQMFRAKTGVNLGFRTLTLDPAYLSATLSADGNTYTLTGVQKALTSLSDVSAGTALAGQFLRKDVDGLWKGAALPAAGIASVSDDPAPALTANLSLNGNRILGQRGGYSGLIEEPQAKTYTLDISCPTQRTLTSITATCLSGTVNFEVRVDDVLVEGLQGQADGLVLSLAPTTTANVPVGGVIQLKVSVVATDSTDFSFSLAYQSA